MVWTLCSNRILRCPYRLSVRLYDVTKVSVVESQWLEKLAWPKMPCATTSPGHDLLNILPARSAEKSEGLFSSAFTTHSSGACVSALAEAI